jgi:hypothetical protein
MRRGLIALLLLTAGAGCDGGGDGEGRDGGPLFGGRTTGRPGELPPVCAAWVEWRDRCPAESSGASDEPAWGESECPTEIDWSYVQQAWVNATASCFETLACDASDDRCTEAGLRALGVDDFEQDVASNPGYQACAQRADGCPELSEDACTSFFVFNAEGRRLAEACLDRECDQIGGCLYHPSGR